MHLKNYYVCRSLHTKQASALSVDQADHLPERFVAGIENVNPPFDGGI